jgi:hypothetical protein
MVELTKEQQKEQLIRDYHEVFGTEKERSRAQKAVIAHMKRGANFDLAIIPKGNDGHIDGMAMARNEGQRSVIVNIERMTMKGT